MDAGSGKTAVVLDVLERVAAHGERVAVVDPGGTWSYREVAADVDRLADALLGDRDDLAEDRVALLCTPGHDFVVGLLACWQAGGVAVPLHPGHPEAELDYVLSDSAATAIVVSAPHALVGGRLAARHGIAMIDVGVDGASRGSRLPVVTADRRALMVYTSGTTGRPKGVVHTHASVTAMVTGLVEAWGWSADDRILLVLPLHHVHGIVNVTLCALWAGALCEAPGTFDALETWRRLATGEVSLFMAVPTIYARLVAAWESADEVQRRAWSAGAAAARLMVSGSAALPASTLERWREITNHVLLERYGMTEVGMALSNTLTSRVPGHVGEPMPGVEVRVVGDDGRDVGDGQPGELLVRGPQLFAEYWGRPEETAAAFVDGWFRTGDVAVHEPGGYRMLGRSSVDIIKTGGEKVSALEVEDVYRTHPAVADCAVVGVPDAEWGERVCAAVVPKGAVAAEELRAWGKDQLAVAKVPWRFVFVDDLPRNAIGKVVKSDVAPLFDESPGDPGLAR